MGKVRTFWRWLGHASLVHWLWTWTVPAGFTGGVIGLVAHLEGRDLSFAILLGLIGFAVVMGLALLFWVGLNERRFQRHPRPAGPRPAVHPGEQTTALRREPPATPPMPVAATEEAPALVAPAPPPPPRPEKLRQQEEGPALAALIEFHDFITEKVLPFQRKLAEARNATNMQKELVGNILKFQADANVLRKQCAELQSKHHMALERIDLLEIKVGILLRDIHSRAAQVYNGRNWPREAQLKEIVPLTSLNNELLRASMNTLEAIRSKRRKYFPNDPS